MSTSRAQSLVAAPAVLALAAATMCAVLPIAPARAQLTVYDPSNHSQNLLTAARALQQVNNQIRSLQNEAAMLLNQAKNLGRVSFPELDALRETMVQMDALMGEAQGIRFRIAGLDREFARLFPNDPRTLVRGGAQVAAARTRLETAMAAYRQTMGVQARVVEAVAADARALDALVARSQSAEGSLAAQQTSNQLLALTAKQQFQLQNLMAAQFRSDSIEAARRVQAETDARAATKRFIGSGRAYTPRP